MSEVSYFFHILRQNATMQLLPLQYLAIRYSLHIEGLRFKHEIVQDITLQLLHLIY